MPTIRQLVVQNGKARVSKPCDGFVPARQFISLLMIIHISFEVSLSRHLPVCANVKRRPWPTRIAVGVSMSSPTALATVSIPMEAILSAS